MADQELKCNVLSCRHSLSSTGKACVTTCSHIFCVPCGNKAFEAALVCPACDTSLTQPDDIGFVDLNPSQEYKSSILSGLRPDVIMEICMRGLSFWSYQTAQEAKYQEMTLKGVEDKLSQAEKQHQRMTREMNAELTGFRDTLGTLQSNLEQEKRKSADMSEQLQEKTRQLSRLQTMFDRVKRRPLFAAPDMSMPMPGMPCPLEPESLGAGGNNPLLTMPFVPEPSLFGDMNPGSNGDRNMNPTGGGGHTTHGRAGQGQGRPSMAFVRPPAMGHPMANGTHGYSSLFPSVPMAPK